MAKRKSDQLKTPSNKRRLCDEKVESSPVRGDNHDLDEDDAIFLGEPLPDEEARKRWPHRYQSSDPEIVLARRHFVQAEVDEQVFNLEDDASVKGDEGNNDYICKIIEFFEAVDGTKNFTAQWYYRGNDTVITMCGNLIDDKLVFFSEIKDVNPLSCLIKKLNIVLLHSEIEYDAKESLKSTCDFYCDKKYLLPCSSFVNLPSERRLNSSDCDSNISSGVDDVENEEQSSERTLLDLYSGCGAMSTGLCLGANSCGVKLVTKWAVDLNNYACESLELNHPETKVRNETAENFLHLLMEWEKLCVPFTSSSEQEELHAVDHDNEEEEVEEEDADENDPDVFEVDEILEICYGDPNKSRSPELYFKIRWKGYGSEEDTWEPLDVLSSCKEKLKEFVSKGYKSRILPLPGTVDVICGGPPCQGISGYNRYRNSKQPLDDPKNKQLVVFMDIVSYLKPKFVLMENVVDILRFAGGFLGRYALGRLVSIGYQARMGMMAAGAYGLPQFRRRMFLWGAVHTERLPQYPLPTHNVIVRGGVPTEFEYNTVAHDAGHDVHLRKELFLGDAISDLPHVENNEERDVMPYDSKLPQTEFQRFIRLRKDEMPGCQMSGVVEHNLYDHRPLCLNKDDYDRVCQVPQRKGANFRDLRGVIVGPDNKVAFDPKIERVLLASGSYLVPNYAMSFINGYSSKPFRRLWWDETVPTVVTRAEPHNQAILHPVQNRVLTIRENARLQGFPDYYKLVGPIKERYTQVGNAVAVPVARALGYSLALALRGLSKDDESAVFELPQDFPMMNHVASPAIGVVEE